MTQSELARLVGIRQATIWNIENGFNCPRLGCLFEIAKALGTTVGKLLEGIQ